MPRMIFTNASIVDCTGAPAFVGEVAVEGNRIAEVVRGGRVSVRDGAQIIDCHGGTLMSGLCDAHSHISWIDQANRDALRNVPLEDLTLACVRNARTYLDCGFTMCVSAAASQPRLDVIIRDAIDRGDIPGPRTLANGPVITTNRDLSEKQVGPRHFVDVEIVEGPEAMRRCVQRVLEQPVDLLKLTMSGEWITGVPARQTLMDDLEARAAVEEAISRGVRVCAHARSADAVKICLRQGVEIIYHASYADSEALDLLESGRMRFFVAPGINWLYTTAYEADRWGVTRARAADLGYLEELETASECMRQMHRRGIRVLPGGDYGFAWCPHGTYARDLEHFVQLFGFSAMDAILSATKLGGEIMGKPHELGQVRPGYLADLIVVDGDPLANVAILQDRARIACVMKDGIMHRSPPGWISEACSFSTRAA